MTPIRAEESASLTAAYERLRTWATDPLPAGPHPAGLALLLQRGIPGWLAGVTSWLPVPGSSRSVAADHPAAVPVTDLVRLLATMVAACQPEEQP